LILLLWRGAHTRQNQAKSHTYQVRPGGQYQAKPHTYQVRPGGHAPDALFLIAPVGFPAGYICERLGFNFFNLKVFITE
jgi:hypothetical protein